MVEPDSKRKTHGTRFPSGCPSLTSGSQFVMPPDVFGRQRMIIDSQFVEAADELADLVRTPVFAGPESANQKTTGFRRRLRLGLGSADEVAVHVEFLPVAHFLRYHVEPAVRDIR